MPEKLREIHLKQFLSTDKNFAILEDCINSVGSEFLDLRKQQTSLQYGPYVNDHRLATLFPECREVTKKMLGLDDISYVSVNLKKGVNEFISFASPIFFGGVNFLPDSFLDSATKVELSKLGAAFMFFIYSMSRIPKIQPHIDSYFSRQSGAYYLEQSKQLYLPPERETSAVGTICHEYDHHIQFDKLSPVPIAQLREGHAYGLELAISRQYAKKKDNVAYVMKSVTGRFRGLRSTYMNLCQETSRPVKDSLAHLIVPKISGHKHALGISCLAVAEQTHGPGIYKDIIEGDYSFLDS